MNIELIIFFALWFVLTEVIFFRYTRHNFDTFFEAKILSIFSGSVLSLLLFGLPSMIAVGPGEADAVGYIAYVWYYGIISIVALFFGINYLIYKKVNKR